MQQPAAALLSTKVLFIVMISMLATSSNTQQFLNIAGATISQDIIKKLHLIFALNHQKTNMRRKIL